MGYMRHHAIVVTGFCNKDIKAARRQAKQLGMAVSKVVGPTVNGTVSFFIAPDGSKESWKESDTGDERRTAFKTWCREQSERYVDWAEVQYGDDNNYSALIDDSDSNTDHDADGKGETP